MRIPTEYIYEMDAAMEQWTDNRVIAVNELENLLTFLIYLPKALSQFQWKLLGFSCRQKNGQYLLTVKVRDGDTPLVAFVTSGTTMGCIGRFLALFDDDRLNWCRDRFPWV